MDEIQNPVEEDAAIEGAVLSLMLTLHPAQVTFNELMSLMTLDESDFAQRDTLEQAVGELVAHGLAHRQEDVIFLSRAAVRCDELLSR